MNEQPIAMDRRAPKAISMTRGFLAALVALYAVGSLTGLSESLLHSSANHFVAGGLLIAAAAICAARAASIRMQRATWVVIACGLGAWGSGEVLFAIPQLGGRGPLSVANLLSLAFYPAAYVSLMMLLRARLQTFFTTLWLDGLAGALSVCALVAAFVFPPVLAHATGSPLTVVGDLSYPLADLMLVACALFAMAMTGWRPGVVLSVIAAAFALVAVTDAYSLWAAATGHPSADRLSAWLWPAAALTIGEVAWRGSPPAPMPNSTSLRSLVFPVVASLAALGVLLSGLVRELDIAGYELSVAALVLIVVRLGLTVLENLQIAESSKREALTDALTGLGNRRRLMLDVEAAFDKGGESSVLALFDLDGFKGYNDTFGHPAGDALLTRLGRAVSAAVEGSGQAYRLGGDEFCVLLRPIGADLPDRLAAATAALSEHGQGFSVAPSYGSVVLPGEAGDVTLALQLADQRLYQHKGSRRRDRDREQVRDVLIQALREKQPDLDEHLGGVAALAHAVSRRLGLSPEKVDEIARAAELHDIGKMAVPDAILQKPGSLDEGETEMIRQHTIIGERILAAAPALKSVGRLVRHSHERYDGHGYPDGLVGDEIPLGSRVIAVCDAFDAMTTDRPYQPAVSVEQALEELRRCAGGQFDPRVIDAFCEEAMTVVGHPELRESDDPADAELDLLVVPPLDEAAAAVADEHQA